MLTITNVTKLKPNCRAVSDSVYTNRIFTSGTMWRNCSPQRIISNLLLSVLIDSPHTLKELYHIKLYNSTIQLVWKPVYADTNFVYW